MLLGDGASKVLLLLALAALARGVTGVALGLLFDLKGGQASDFLFLLSGECCLGFGGGGFLTRLRFGFVPYKAVMISFELKAARIYAELRTIRPLRAPDAIQLACAANANVDLFITNDERLQGKHVQGIQFIVPLDRAPI